MVENKKKPHQINDDHAMMFLEKEDFDLSTIFFKNLEYFLEISH